MVDDLDIEVWFQAFLERTNVFCFYSFFWEIVPQFCNFDKKGVLLTIDSCFFDVQFETMI